MRFFDALGLRDLADRVTVLGRGIVNNWSVEAPIVRDNYFLLVDRVELAGRLFEEAKSRGVIVETIARTPLLLSGSEGRPIEVAGQPRKFAAAIDASGRAAAWSRPVKRVRHLVADIFEANCPSPSSALRLARWGDGWAYRIGLRGRATVALLAPSLPRNPQAFPEQLAADLELRDGAIRRIGRRVAFVQASTHVVRGRALAVGDAAFAHDPVSGQGLQFALSSALAASAVIRSWLDSPKDSSLAAQFYDGFVSTERRRHLHALQSLYGECFDFRAVFSTLPDRALSKVDAPRVLPSRLKFCASVESSPLNLGGRIEQGTSLRLDDGGSVRWLGGFDLLELRHLAREPITIPQLLRHMITAGLGYQQSMNIIRWCYARGILR
jgi:hypothetical protein